MPYNGYKNYETWVTHTWLTDNWERYPGIRGIAENSPNEHEAARQLKAWHENAMPNLRGSVWADLLRCAFDGIDWHEIVRSLAIEYGQNINENSEED